jgi:hypothetical protein
MAFKDAREPLNLPMAVLTPPVMYASMATPFFYEKILSKLSPQGTQRKCGGLQSQWDIMAA